MEEHEEKSFGWEELVGSEKIVAADKLGSIWRAWAQGEGFTIRCSLGEWRAWEDPAEWCDAFTVTFKQDHALCHIDSVAINSAAEKLRGKDRPKEKFSISKDCIRSALLRSGWKRHTNVDLVCSQLIRQDDVILCADTNLLFDCVFSSILLPELEKHENPNWILIVIPKVGMAEIEEWASGKSSRFGSGYPKWRSRVAHRALEEILALDTSKDPVYKGLSIITAGELPPNYRSVAGDSVLKDSAIRKQFRDFLQAIAFHKTSFLVSEDKVNIMMARAEGLPGLYLQKPEWKEIESESILEEKDDVARLWRLIYELSVAFGRLRIQTASNTLDLDISWPGKRVIDWEGSKVFVVGETR